MELLETIRAAEQEDLAQLVRLERLAFAPTKTNSEIEREWFQGTVHLPDRTLFLVEEPETQTAIGSYAQIDFTLQFVGQEFPTMGIAAVAVATHRRGQQVAQIMLHHAVETARSRQLPLMMLYPFQHGFYRKLGWAWVGETRQYRISTNQLTRFVERLNVVPYDSTAHLESLKAAYDKASSRHNGWLKRRDWQWEQMFKPSHSFEIYCYIEAGQVQGYLITQFAFSDALPNTTLLYVREWVALTPIAYRGLLGFLASLRDQVTTIVWNTYPSDPFPHLLREQRRDPTLQSPRFEFGLVHGFGEVGAGFMWRLVDVPKALEQRTISPVPPFRLTFHITDPILGEQTVTAEFADEHMRCVSEESETVIRLSIEDLTLLFSGMRRASDLLWTGEIEVEGDLTLLASLDAAWQTTPPFCWDFF